MSRGPAIHKHSGDSVSLERLFHRSPRNIAENFIENPSQMREGLEELMRADPQKGKAILGDIAKLVSANSSGASVNEVVEVLRELAASVSGRGIQNKVTALANQVENLGKRESHTSEAETGTELTLDHRLTVKRGNEALSQVTDAGVGIVASAVSPAGPENVRGSAGELSGEFTKRMHELDVRRNELRERRTNAHSLLRLENDAFKAAQGASIVMEFSVVAGIFVACSECVHQGVAFMAGTPLPTLSWANLLAPFTACAGAGLLCSPILYVAYKVAKARQVFDRSEVELRACLEEEMSLYSRYRR